MVSTLFAKNAWSEKGVERKNEENKNEPQSTTKTQCFH